MQLIAFTGYAGSGKDEAAKALVADGFVRVAFADAVREALLALDPCIEVGPSEAFSVLRVQVRTTYYPRLSRIVEAHGWDSAKRIDNARRLLQRMGTEAGRDIHGDNCWTRIAGERIHRACHLESKSVVVTDCRFANEAHWIRQWDGKVVRIDRPGVGPINAHASDSLEGIEPDVVIVNDGTVEELHRKVRELVGA